ncbi:MAG: D-alanyl-D-alanine carboxypeptidase [Pelagibacteraceae bacterium]|nr:D-alanyl-D-alanine carboxypeptidase [Pelagibacteraceae bacterium]PPR33006.1 MAG: D-alanyl-D-alanine carboxypeptidase DacC [Alphaproteobacteria bacterium MarineAlpha6_Bin5]|tara:strand:- start:694 stop:1830 length:1137 start_codon:yes stop_codon:yes gene_type:complete
MIISMKKILIFFTIYFLMIFDSFGVETKADSAFVLDFNSNTVLFEKNSDEKQGPASMSKLMIIYMVLERLQNGTLNLDEEFLVSRKAWKYGGSKMFVNVGDNVSVKDLLRGVIVQSGNDACIVLAEGLSGSEENMVDEMNEKAVELGLTNSNFNNTTGWPHEDHYMSLRDIAVLSRIIIDKFPEYYSLFKLHEFTYNEIHQFNRNKLLSIDGYDGLKTGRTTQSGYGLAASAIKDNRRIISVVNGLNSDRERINETKKLVNWSFREFINYNLYKSGDTIHSAKVWLGKDPFVPLILKEDLTVTVKKRDVDKFEVKLIYETPFLAPIKKGDKLAELHLIEKDKTVIKEVYSGKDIYKVSRFYRSFSIINYLLFGVSNKN